MRMQMLCENIAKFSVPAIRAAVSESLYKEYGMSQEAIAKKLGIAQPAVYKYVHKRYSAKVLRMCAFVKSKNLHKKIILKILNGSSPEDVERWVENAASTKCVSKYCSLL